MPVGTVGEAQAIARDVAAILDAVAPSLDRRADRALNGNHIDDAITLRQSVEELARQAKRLRDI